MTFSINFYKTFWNLRGQLVLDSLNFGYHRGHLSIEQTRGIVTLILKGNKAATSLQNYRPITLLNTDYKIAAKVIASRLKRVIHDLIGPHQTGFLKGRFVGENIRLTLDLIEHCSCKDLSGFLLLLDFEKAFDKLEWPFVRKTLSYFNFGISFKNWIDVFYSNCNTCICNNGYSTGFFSSSAGCPSGLSLKPVFIYSSARGPCYQSPL